MEGTTVVAVEHRCPECRQVLEPAGEIALGAARVPVYRCPSCIEDGELFGMRFDAPVMFAILRGGEVVRPADWRA